MQIDPARQTGADNYKLLTNLVVPRPIAWITSMNQAGVVNLAPFSFFNAVGSKPLYLVVSIGLRDNGTLKDSARNIESSGEFVVNLVTENLLQQMNLSAADFPPDQSSNPKRWAPTPSLSARSSCFMSPISCWDRSCTSTASRRSEGSGHPRSTAAPPIGSSCRASATPTWKNDGPGRLPRAAP
jgi:hypothetical protein